MKNLDFLHSLPKTSFILTGSYALTLQDKEFAKHRKPNDIDICIEREYEEFIRFQVEKKGGVCKDEILHDDPYQGADWFIDKITFDDGSSIDVLAHAPQSHIDISEPVPFGGKEYRSVPLKQILRYKIDIVKSSEKEDQQIKHMHDIIFFLKSGKISIS